MVIGIGEIPAEEEIVLVRNAAGLTQREAAALVHTTMRTWRSWEAGERRMHPAIWELFHLKVAIFPLPGGIRDQMASQIFE
ncbi:helix-turn-helix domain-containing protein [Burkholderia metallica]|uniref:helix-turn-helix domain-containing protein n=1 Tax=Burkholderia metallica TaxID=488729 RepID=UPI001CF10077|nr:helix-turn-helix domain-containing protein [Burkholderia metallica]MCA8003520.1 helix-turn-helix domain-containing protein [Burkholderia metallica]